MKAMEEVKRLREENKSLKIGNKENKVTVEKIDSNLNLKSEIEDLRQHKQLTDVKINKVNK